MAKLPTIYHGLPKDDEDTAIVDAALQDVFARLNSVPDHLGERVICSVMLSACCAQLDPLAALRMISANVSSGIRAHLANPEGSA